MIPALDACLRAPTQVPPRASAAEWWPRWRTGAALAASSAEQALLGGFDADRVGWAFASGYQAALRALLPELPADAVAAFCVTEETGNRPRDIHTRITPAADGSVSISGAKRWTTLGPDSSVLLIVGALPPGPGPVRPQLKVARVPVGTPGLQLLPMPETRFVPEVPHARVLLDAVKVDADALLPGDGYERCVKPFRTLEDSHVTLAVLAYLLREARQRGWPTGFAERLCATLAVLCDLAAAPANAPVTHVVLAGALAQAHALYAEAGTLWAAAGDDPAAVRWARDVALFGVAGSARSQRAARAWERLQQAPDVQLRQVLFSQGFGTRRECDALIQHGLVQVGERLVDDPHEDVDTTGLVFSVRGQAWSFHERALLMMNKPPGYECSRKPKHHPSVMSLLPAPLRQREVQPIGRLDEDTTGLLLFTDDGALIHKLTSPKWHVPKLYRVECAEPVTAAQIERLLAGVVLHDDPLPVRAAACLATGERGLLLTLTEGKYHQVKRMVAAAGNHVAALQRTAFGVLQLPADLQPGQWRWVERAAIAPGL